MPLAAAEPPVAVFAPRRRRFALLVSGTVLACVALLAATLSVDGLDGWDLAILTCFAVTLPWTAIGFWNAVIGFALMGRAPTDRGPPGPIPPDGTAPIATRTAILCCIRNEDVPTVARNLDRMLAELAGTPEAERFAVWILSDSDWPERIAAEERAHADLAARWGCRIPVHYRRRVQNRGFKAGNIMDFAQQQGQGDDFALVLDADSLMDARAVLDLVRALEANPRVGILQTLVVGLPAASAFARAFQFGMRLGMRSYTLGSAWWQGDCGPYWGHNALIRLAPFREHCALPRLPGDPPLGGWILSHDQVEAALMRRAGYEVRVLPTEGGSWEENPTTLPDLIRRDLRWCQGNLQYLRLLSMPGLQATSRVQLALAVLMFLASPAWVLLMALGALRVGLAPPGSGLMDPALGLATFAAVMTMVYAPKLASLVHVLAAPQSRRAFGGGPRVLLGAAGEILFSALLAPIMAIAHTVLMTGLLFGRAIVWEPQRRATHRVGVREALSRLWPQTLIGAATFLWLAWLAPQAAPWLSPFFLGALLAVPLAVLTALPGLGLAAARVGLWRIPEETEPGPMARSLDLPALAAIRGCNAAPSPAQAHPLVEGLRVAEPVE